MDQSPITIRKAILEDRAVIAAWFQDPLYEALFSKRPTVSKEVHKAWFDSINTSEKSILCIGLMDIIRIGAIKFDEQNKGIYRALIFLKPAYNRQNLLSPFLCNASRFLCSLYSIDHVYVNVPLLNAWSKRSFETEMFEISEENDKQVKVIYRPSNDPYYNHGVNR